MEIEIISERTLKVSAPEPMFAAVVKLIGCMSKNQMVASGLTEQQYEAAFELYKFLNDRHFDFS